MSSDDSKTWDVFISHASEDKEAFVRPIARWLQNMGVAVWYDEFSLRIGDSLSRSIDKGLASSRFGIVVISAHFLNKKWPEYELRGLVTREIEEGRIILPIWLEVNRTDVIAFSPTLADKVAITTKGLTPNDVAIQILREVRPDLYANHISVDGQQIRTSEELLKEFGETFRDYERKVLRGEERRVLLELYVKYISAVSELREMLTNLLGVVEAYNAALATDSGPYTTKYDSGSQYGSSGSQYGSSQSGIPSYKRSGFSSTGSGWRADSLRNSMNSTVTTVKRKALKVDEAKNRLQADASFNRVTEPGTPEHGYSIEYFSAVCQAVLRSPEPPASQWWINDKLARWVQHMPIVEASIEGTINIIKSWEPFDPKQ